MLSQKLFAALEKSQSKPELKTKPAATAALRN